MVVVGRQEQCWFLVTTLDFKNTYLLVANTFSKLSENWLVTVMTTIEKQALRKYLPATGLFSSQKREE